MAGIGIKLQKLLDENTFSSTISAYSQAAMVSIGPWIIAIVGILLAVMLKVIDKKFTSTSLNFQISIVYLTALSIIFSSFGHQNFSRFIADKIFLKHKEQIFPNYMGLVFMITLIGAVLAYPLSFYLFSNYSIYYRILMPANFIVLSNVWASVCLLTGLKNAKSVVICFLVGYAAAVIVGYLLRHYGVDGLLLGFLFGQFLILIGVAILTFYSYPSESLLSFEFLLKRSIFPTLVFASLFYNIALWADKFIFWFSSITGASTFPPLHSSLLYDLPMFIGYMCMLPGLIVCVLNVETYFFKHYSNYYNSVREGHTLFDILDIRYHMIRSVDFTLREIIKIQGLICLAVFIFMPKIFSIFHLSPYHLYLVNIDVVATSLLVILITILYIFNYFDRRKELFYVSLLFCVSNIVLTAVSLYLGIGFYGYGFAVSIFISTTVGLFVLNHFLNNLEFKTFVY